MKPAIYLFILRSFNYAVSTADVKYSLTAWEERRKVNGKKKTLEDNHEWRVR
jgi:hypothetical protein